METRDRRDNDVEGNLPWDGILGSRCLCDIIARSELEKFAKFEAALGDDGVVVVLARVEVSEISLCFGRGTEFG